MKIWHSKKKKFEVHTVYTTFRYSKKMKCCHGNSFLWWWILLLCLSAALGNQCRIKLSTDCKCQPSQSGAISASCDFNNQSKPARVIQKPTDGENVNFRILNISTSKPDTLTSSVFNGIKYVDFLDLTSNSISVFPNFLFGIRSIQTIDLSNNAITHLSTKQHSVLNLKRLNLSSNKIQFINPIFFKSFPDLEELDLSRNNITTLQEGVFTYIVSVLYLDLSQNNLLHISNSHFNGAGYRLRSIDISNNKLKTIHPDFFVKFDQLKTINLSYNTLLPTFDQMSFPQHLSSIDLSNCGLASLNFCELSTLVDLEMVNISGNNIPCSCETQWLNEQIQSHQENSQHRVNLQTQCVSHVSDINTVETLSLNCSGKDRNVLVAQCKDRKSKHVAMYQLERCKEEITFDSDFESDTISASWTTGEHCTDIFGYFIDIVDNAGKKVYDTAIFHPITKSFTFTDPDLCCGEIVVCLKVMLNQTYVFTEVCHKHYSAHAHMVVGILAGTIFLIPCIGVLIYVLYQDSLRKDTENNGKTSTNGDVSRMQQIWHHITRMTVMRNCFHRTHTNVQNHSVTVKTLDADQKTTNKRNENSMEVFAVSPITPDESGVANDSFCEDDENKCLTC